VFAAEGGYDDAKFDVDSNGPNNPPSTFLYQNDYYFYASAAWRANHWLQLGGYYSQYHWQQRGVNLSPGIFFPNRNQRDYALCARFDLTDYLIFKIEGHFFDGAGQVFGVGGANPSLSQLDKNWFMLDAKITISF
jgi:hypothetical protein